MCTHKNTQRQVSVNREVIYLAHNTATTASMVVRQVYLKLPSKSPPFPVRHLGFPVLQRTLTAAGGILKDPTFNCTYLHSLPHERAFLKSSHTCRLRTVIQDSRRVATEAQVSCAFCLVLYTFGVSSSLMCVPLCVCTCMHMWVCTGDNM